MSHCNRQITHLHNSMEHTVVYNSSIEFPQINTLVSSANRFTAIKPLPNFCMSFTAIKYKIGPSIDPCGTPQVTFLVLDWQSLTTMY